MPATISPPQETGEQRIVLNHVSWDTYERLLSDHMDASAPRFTYDRGALEIMSPSTEHEELKENLAAIADALAEEWGIDFRRLGSTTFRKRDLEGGVEPDACFYLQNADRIRGKREIDLMSDLPPDLVIEVVITNPWLDKMAVYARPGVPEVWRNCGQNVRIFQLRGSATKRAPRAVFCPP